MRYNFSINLIGFIIFYCCSVNTDAQNWVPLDKGIGHPYATIYHLLPDSNCIYISGAITEDGYNNPLRGIAKWDGIRWDSVGNAHEGNGKKDCIVKYRDTLYTSSIFYNMWHVVFAKFNGENWDTIPNTTDLDVNCFIEKDSILYMGGYFTKCGNDNTYLLGKYDGTYFSGMTPLYSNYSSGDAVVCMTYFNDTLYVGGLFYLYPELPIACFAKWDGYNLLPVSSQFSNTTCVIEAMTVYKNELYIGGEFYKANGFTGNCIMKWDGHNFTEVGGGTNQRVTCMKVYNNELYVGGWFSTVGSDSCKNIAKWDGNKWTCLNNDAFDDFYCIRDICIYNDTLYIAGSFNKIGNDSINNIAKYNHPLVGVKENPAEENNFTIYPNPASDKIIIETSQKSTIEISNMQGQLIKAFTTSGKMNIDISSFPSGVYIVEVKTEKGVAVKKFVKE